MVTVAVRGAHEARPVALQDVQEAAPGQEKGAVAELRLARRGTSPPVDLYNSPCCARQGSFKSWYDPGLPVAKLYRSLAWDRYPLTSEAAPYLLAFITTYAAASPAAASPAISEPETAAHVKSTDIREHAVCQSRISQVI